MKTLLTMYRVIILVICNQNMIWINKFYRNINQAYALHVVKTFMYKIFTEQSRNIHILIHGIPQYDIHRQPFK